MAWGLIITLATLFLCSCGTGLSVRKSQVKYLDTQFSGTFDNNVFKVSARRYGSATLLELFEIYHVKVDSVTIKYDSLGNLELTYKDNGGNLRKDTFKGTFAKKGYYEIFFSNEKKEIPPVFPIIFGKYNVRRIRVALTITGDLIIDSKWNKSGNILFLGVGDKGRQQSFFQ